MFHPHNGIEGAIQTEKAAATLGHRICVRYIMRGHSQLYTCETKQYIICFHLIYCHILVRRQIQDATNMSQYFMVKSAEPRKYVESKWSKYILKD